MNAAIHNPLPPNWQNSGASSRNSSGRREQFPATSMPFSPGRSTATGAFKMRCCFNFFASLVALAASGAAPAQTPDYKNVGRAPTEQEVQAMDIAIGADGKELPPGNGIAKDGAKIFKAKCEIRHAMPRYQEGSLSADEVYSLVALVLYRNDIIKEEDVIDAKTLPKIQMPNRNGFIPQKLEEIHDPKKRGCRMGHCP